MQGDVRHAHRRHEHQLDCGRDGTARLDDFDRTGRQLQLGMARPQPQSLHEHILMGRHRRQGRHAADCQRVHVRPLENGEIFGAVARQAYPFTDCVLLVFNFRDEVGDLAEIGL